MPVWCVESSIPYPKKFVDFALSQKIVVATAVLFNLARMWEDVDIQGEEEDDDAGDEGVDDDDTEEIVVYDAAIATIRQRGKFYGTS